MGFAEGLLAGNRVAGDILDRQRQRERDSIEDDWTERRLSLASDVNERANRVEARDQAKFELDRDNGEIARLSEAAFDPNTGEARITDALRTAVLQSAHGRRFAEEILGRNPNSTVDGRPFRVMSKDGKAVMGDVRPDGGTQYLSPNGKPGEEPQVFDTHVLDGHLTTLLKGYRNPEYQRLAYNHHLQSRELEQRARLAKDALDYHAKSGRDAQDYSDRRVDRITAGVPMAEDPRFAELRGLEAAQYLPNSPLASKGLAAQAKPRFTVPDMLAPTTTTRSYTDPRPGLAAKANQAPIVAVGGYLGDKALQRDGEIHGAQADLKRLGELEAQNTRIRKTLASPPAYLSPDNLKLVEQTLAKNQAEVAALAAANGGVKETVTGGKLGLDAILTPMDAPAAAPPPENRQKIAALKAELTQDGVLSADQRRAALAAYTKLGLDQNAAQADGYLKTGSYIDPVAVQNARTEAVKAETAYRKEAQGPDFQTELKDFRESLGVANLGSDEDAMARFGVGKAEANMAANDIHSVATTLFNQLPGMDRSGIQQIKTNAFTAYTRMPPEVRRDPYAAVGALGVTNAAMVDTIGGETFAKAIGEAHNRRLSAVEFYAAMRGAVEDISTKGVEPKIAISNALAYAEARRRTGRGLSAPAR